METTNYATTIAKQFNLRPEKVNAAIELFGEGNTIPFIARYRKEVTGTLDEEQLRQIESTLGKLRALDERRATIISSVEETGNMTDELRKKIIQAETITALEDIYQPYKPKRRTRASIAKEKGLQQLADLILSQARLKESPDNVAQRFLNDQVQSIEEALAGARDIVAETISDHPEVRRKTREKANQWGLFLSKKIEAADDPRRVYELYYDFSIKV
ncbi:MAG: RNA-binding transcriptional accessory protein, partial [Anaerolineaceae bacterium]|nr:RNA-binding transcriptional accessory protein [Anaerolineaceae bacterium]